ncbi:MAG: hypothetical protein BWX44_00064 [Spirochaetes bacterium ADurb.Bin001]|nr:MAG: hypothetical protein BWX44_00064 [Spirochaetes bacterium ADurb.Bin001]
MAGNKEQWNGGELRKYVQENIPGTIVVTRKPTNHCAVVIEKGTGKILYWGEKNFEIMNKLTSPDTVPKRKAAPQPLFDIPPQLNINTMAENTAKNALYYLIELTELMGGKKCVIKYKDGNFPDKVVCGPLEFTLGGMKIKGGEGDD